MLTNMELRNAHISAKNRLSAAEYKKYDANNKARGLYPYNINVKNYLRYLIINHIFKTFQQRYKFLIVIL